MWWIVLIIITVVIAIIIGIVLASVINLHERGDYGDGGGIVTGDNQNYPFFGPRTDKAGIYGEKVAAYHLRPLLRADEHLLTNVILPIRNGKKIEIDCVLISRKGVFCVEIKKWVGHISGNDDDEYWLQEYDDPHLDDRRHRNPVKQNDFHSLILFEKLNKKYSISNVVIFVKLDDGSGIHSNNAFTLWGFKTFYRGKADDLLDIEDVNGIYDSLVRYVATREQLINYKKNRESGNN